MGTLAIMHDQMSNRAASKSTVGVLLVHRDGLRSKMLYVPTLLDVRYWYLFLCESHSVPSMVYINQEKTGVFAIGPF